MKRTVDLTKYRDFNASGKRNALKNFEEDTLGAKFIDTFCLNDGNAPWSFPYEFGWSEEYPLIYTGKAKDIRREKLYIQFETGDRCNRCGKQLRTKWEGSGTLLCEKCINEVDEECRKKLVGELWRLREVES